MTRSSSFELAFMDLLQPALHHLSVLSRSERARLYSLNLHAILRVICRALAVERGTSFIVSLSWGYFGEMMVSLEEILIEAGHLF